MAKKPEEPAAPGPLPAVPEISPEDWALIAELREFRVEARENGACFIYLRGFNVRVGEFLRGGSPAERFRKALDRVAKLAKK